MLGNTETALWCAVLAQAFYDATNRLPVDYKH